MTPVIIYGLSDRKMRIEIIALGIIMLTAGISFFPIGDIFISESRYEYTSMHQNTHEKSLLMAGEFLVISGTILFLFGMVMVLEGLFLKSGKEENGEEITK